ncbi:MAG: hypothetical protein COA75_06835 [Cellvibrionales bacterium]|nr:MAG: hypothetical protein COA75_06835 [Cellvibrionales bacterium]
MVTTVLGRIIEPNQQKGIGNLMVTAALISKQEHPASNANEILGSTATDIDGNFAIHWKGEQDITSNMQVVLSIEAPLKPDSDNKPIFQTQPRTITLGTTSTFLIELSKRVIEDFKVIPLKPTDAKFAVSQIKEAAEQAKVVEQEWATVARQRVAIKRKAKDQFVAGFRNKLMEDIATQPADIAKGEQMVVEGDADRSVDAVTLKNLQQGARDFSSVIATTEGTRRITRYFLTAAQRAELRRKLDTLQPGTSSLQRADIEEILIFGENLGGDARPFALGGEEAQFEQFTQMTFDEQCAQTILDRVDGVEEPENPLEETEDEITKEDIKRQLSRVTSDINSPIGALKGRPGQEDVIGNIRDFSLSPGPADSASVFDFHQLSIAFNHVWKEFLDDRIEPLAESAFMSLVEQGGDPESALPQSHSALSALDAEERLVSAAAVGSSPKAAYAQHLSNQFNNSAAGLSFGRNDNGPLYPGLPGQPSRGRDRPSDSPPRGSGRPVVDEYENDELFADVPVKTTIQKLRDILRGRYAFTAYGADHRSHAINFGVNITYRQRWEPVAYQVGELHHSVTLSPGESRKYSTKTKITRKRVEKEVEKHSSILKDQLDSTGRAESEIIKKAESKTNFTVASEGTYNFLIASGDATTTVGHDASNASDSTKKSFREAVTKSSEEYRQERTLEVIMDDTFDFEESESGEIKNPNDELTATYLFYELQRRFRVNEQIYKATPVVLVAQDIPNPNHIDEAFLIRHGWILKRALLDDMYEDILTYVAGPMAGNKVAKDALYTAMRKHENIVDTLKDDLHALKEQASVGYEALQRAIEARIGEGEEEDTDGLFADIGDFFGGGGQSTEGAQAREEAAKAHERRAVEQVKQRQMALQREVSAYTAATEKYTSALKLHKEWELKVVDLLLHVKENIIHYMQAIWAYEHPDERFLRLQYKKAPTFNEVDGGAQYTFLGDASLTRETVRADGTQEIRTAVEFEYKPNFEIEQAGKTLSEIADLDSLLGFKGNYMIFPLRESNALTDFMMEPYVDAGFRLLDPHDAGNINREQFARYICHLREQLDDQAFEEIRPALRERFRQLLLSEPNKGDEIIVPTGSLYIEALPGSNALLEDFKLAHRALDVVQAQEEARQTTLDNIRRAARMLDDDFSDPDIDAKYVFEKPDGGDAVVVAPAPGGND